MFRLYDTTRRRICTAAFCLLCLAPTVCTIGWCVTRHLPRGLQNETQRLSQLLGLDVSIERLRYLRPGQVLYEGVKLSDPETGQMVFRCRAVEAAWTKAHIESGARKPAVVLMLSQPEIDAAASDRLCQLLQRMLRGGNGIAEIEVRVTAGELTVRAGEYSQTLTSLEAGIGTMPGGIQAEAAFRLAGTQAPEPVRVRVVRNRQVTPPADGFELDTGGVELPAPLLAVVMPECKLLGPSGRLCGYVCAVETSQGWEGSLAGQLRGVDLGSLISDHFPHKMSGTAEVTIEPVARFRRGRLEEASGTLTTGPGVIGRSLIESAASYLRMTRGTAAGDSADLLPYAQLALAFSLDSQGIRLQGRCAGGEPEAVLVDRQGRLLGAPATQPLPVVALIRMLVPASEIHVPATRQTDWLARRLPVPDVLPPPGSRPGLPHARLRLSSAER